MKFHTDNNNLFLFGDIEKDDSFHLQEELRYVKEEDMNAIFNSNGGLTKEAYLMAGLLTRGHIFRSFGEKSVHSACIIPFIMGYERYATRKTEFLFHYPTFAKRVPERVTKLKIKELQTFISERTNLSLDEIDKLMSQSTRVSAQGAIDFGIINDFS